MYECTGVYMHMHGCYYQYSIIIIIFQRWFILWHFCCNFPQWTPKARSSEVLCPSQKTRGRTTHFVGMVFVSFFFFSLLPSLMSTLYDLTVYFYTKPHPSALSLCVTFIQMVWSKLQSFITMITLSSFLCCTLTWSSIKSTTC